MTRQDARQQSAEQASKPQSGERLAHPTEGQSKAESMARVSNLHQAPLKGLYSANFRSLTGPEGWSRRLTQRPHRHRTMHSPQYCDPAMPVLW